MTQIKNIIFDLGGVLIKLRDDDDWLENYMIPLLGEDGLEKTLEGRYFNSLELGQLTINEFYDQLISISNNQFSLAKLKDAFNGKLLDIPSFRIENLYELSKRFNLFLLSNTNHIHLEFILEYIEATFKKNVFEQVFEKCFYSQVLQLGKPGKKIYEAVLQKTNIIAEETLFIDDSEVNLIEPQKLGIQTIHFKNDDQFREELSALLNQL